MTTPSGTLVSSVAYRVLAGTTYDIAFNTLFGLTPTSGSFTYDPVHGFSGFTVLFNGTIFDLTESANHPTVGGTGCAGEKSDPAYGFALLSQSVSNCSSPDFFWSVGYGGIGTASMSFALDANSGTDEVVETSPYPIQNIGNSTGGWSITPRQ